MRIIPSEIWAFFLPIYKKHKKYFFLLLFSSAISGLTSVFMPLLLKAETDQLAAQYSLDLWWQTYTPFVVFIAILGMIFLTSLISNLITAVIRIYTNAHWDYIRNSLQYALLSRMKNMEVGNTLMGRFHRLSRMIDDSIEGVSNTFLSFPASTLRTIIEITGLTLVFAYFDIRLLGVVLISSVLWYLLRGLSEKISKKYEIAWEFSLGQKLYFYSQLFFRHFPQVAMNGAVKQTLHRYHELLEAEIQNGIQKDWSGLRYSLFDTVISSAGEILIRLFVGYGVFVGTNSIGMVALVVASMSTIENLFQEFLHIRFEYRQFRMEMHSMLLLLKMTKAIGSVDTYEKPLESITLKNIGFTYPNVATYEREYLEIVEEFIGKKASREAHIEEVFGSIVAEIREASQTSFTETLHNVSFRFEVGKLYGIVGRNGAGKTTLMQLLAGFFRNYQGDILFNDANIREWKPELIARYVSFLTQNPFYLGYGATLRENLLFGAILTDESIIWKYLEDFGLAKKIRKTKKGLDAAIGDDIEFSGGEQQLLAFIRLLLQDKPIVILDEWSNQLDAENEIRMFDALLEKRKEKIIIFITHRMSTVSRADEIFTLENGTITHHGTHHALLEEKDNLYSQFYTSQVLHYDR